MLLMMFMLMMLLLMKLEKVPTVFLGSDKAMPTATLNYIECHGQVILHCGPMDGSFAQCNVED